MVTRTSFRPHSVLLVIFIGLFGANAFAVGELPQTFTLDGQLMQAGTELPLLDTNAKIVVQILDPTKTCLLYEEEQFVNTSSTSGYYNIQIGSNTGAGKRTGSDPGRTMVQIFQNRAAIVANNAPGQTCAGGTYTPAVMESRFFRLIVTPSATNIADTLSPDTVMDSVPNSLVAETLQGLAPDQFLQIGAGDLSQANLQTVFAAGNAAKLNSLLSVNPANYVTKDSTNGTIAIPSASAPATPQIGQIWYDSGSLKFWNGSEQTLGISGAGISSLVAGTGLNVGAGPGGTITTSGTLNLDVGNTVGKIVQVQAAGKLPVLDGSNLTNISGSSISSGTIGGTTSFSGSGNIQTTGDITSKRTFLYDNAGAGPGYVGFQPPADIAGSGGASYTLTFPNTAGLSGQVLRTDGTGVLSWIAPNSGTVTNVATGTGLTGGPVSTTGTISLANTTVTANPYGSATQVGTFTVDAQGRLTAAANVTISGVAPGGSASGDLSGSYPSPTVVKIQGKAVSTTAPTAAGHVLRYDGATEYVPGFIGVADLRSSIGPTYSQFLPLNCTAGQTLTWNVVTDQMDCTNIAVSDSQITYASKTQNTILAAPNGSNGVPTFRAIAAADIPSLDWSKIGSGKPTTLVGYGITDGVQNAGGTQSILSDVIASRPAASGPTTGRLFVSTDEGKIYRDNGSGWDVVGSATGTGGTITGVTAGTGLSGGGATGSVTLNLANTTVTANPYGSATEVGTFTVDAQGRLTAAANVTISGVAPGGAASGDLSGSYPGPTVAKIQGKAVSATTPTAAGHVLRYDGTTQYVPAFLNITDVRSSIGPTYAAFFPLNCAAGQTLTWNVVTDQMDCTNIAVSDSQITYASKTQNTFLAAPNGSNGAPTFRTIATADLPSISSGLSGTLPIGSGGTGQTTASAAFNALSPTTTLGDIIYGGASGAGTRLAGNTTAAKRFLTQTGDGTNSAAPAWGALVAGDVPTLNQNTTGTAANVTGTVAIANGGTGATTQQAAMNALAGAVTSAQFLRGNGTNVVMAAISASDVPTLNQNTTGSAAKWTTARDLAGNSVDGSANVAFANKFIVQGTADAGLSGAQFLGSLGTGIVKNTTTTGVLSIAVAGDFPTLNQNTTGTAANVTGTVAVANGGTGVTSLPGTFVLNGGQAGAVTLGPSDANSLTLNTSGTAKMTILSSGNVGIGTATPSAGMHVAVSAASSKPMALISGTWFTSGSSTTNKPQLLIEVAGTTSTGWNGSGTGFGINAPNTFSGALADFQVNGSSQVQIGANGNIISNGDIYATNLYPSGKVGIGTTGPQATLDVNGYARLKSYASAPVACAAGNAGALALTSNYTGCVCNGTSWIKLADATACVW